MTDIILVAVLAAFFALAVRFVRACERIVGPDTEADVTPAESIDERRAAA